MRRRFLKRGPRRRVQTGRRVAAAAANGLRNRALARAPRRGRGKVALSLQLEQLLLLEEMELQTDEGTDMESVRATGTEQEEGYNRGILPRTQRT